MEVDPGPSDRDAERSDIEADTEVEDAMKNGLKRSSSAPLINQLVAAEVSQTRETTGGARRQERSYIPAPAAASRWRRWSTSTSLSPVSPGSPINSQGAGYGWARLNRLRVEESGDVVVREIQTERDVHRGLCIENSLSQSWEDLSLTDNKDANKISSASQSSHASRRSGSSDPMTPLTIGVGPFPSPRTSPSPSPSPTRSSVPGKQCFSPSMQMPVPNLSFSPSPSSSPTRRWASRRSLSPITLRPSPLGPVKRKCMLDEADSGIIPSKRHSSLLSITHQNNSYRAAPYRLPSHLGNTWSGSAPGPGPGSGPPSDHSGSRESSPSPAPIFPASPATMYPTTSSPSLMDTNSTGPGHGPTETSL